MAFVDTLTTNDDTIAEVCRVKLNTAWWFVCVVVTTLSTESTYSNSAAFRKMPRPSSRITSNLPTSPRSCAYSDNRTEAAGRSDTVRRKRAVTRRLLDVYALTTHVALTSEVYLPDTQPVTGLMVKAVRLPCDVWTTME